MQSTFQKALTNSIKKNLLKSGHKMDLYPAMISRMWRGSLLNFYRIEGGMVHGGEEGVGGGGSLLSILAVKFDA